MSEWFRARGISAKDARGFILDSIIDDYFYFCFFFAMGPTLMQVSVPVAIGGGSGGDGGNLRYNRNYLILTTT